jgi:CheY-like chemotaxis protein
MNATEVASMTTKTILLINSEPSVRELVQTCLNDWGGWLVLCASSLTTGLQRAVQDQPDAIVLDFSPARKDYVTFLQKLRAQPETQRIPVVVLTVGAKWLDSRWLQQLQVVGAIDYTSDPSKLSYQIAMLLNWEEQPQSNEGEE